MIGLYLGSSWLIQGHYSWGIGRCIPLFICLAWSGYIRSCSIGAVCCRISLSSLITRWLQIIFLIGSPVTFGGFPSKFLKCCLHRCIRSSWLAAFSLALAVFFLLLTSFTLWHAILNCLSSTESLILLIWFGMYSVCSFKIYISLFWAFLRFRAFILVGFLLWHRDVVFASVCFFLTANASQI